MSEIRQNLKANCVFFDNKNNQASQMRRDGGWCYPGRHKGGRISYVRLKKLNYEEETEWFIELILVK